MNKKDTLKLELIRHLQTIVGKDKRKLEDILFAYDLAKAGHQGQFRDGGKEYITHPVEGCIMLANNYAITDPATYTVFMLHDTGEDTTIFGDLKSMSWETFAYTLRTRIGRLFGKTVAETVLLLTKPRVNGHDFKDQEEMLVHYLANLRNPSQYRVRAVFCKMIDRLHNLCSLQANNPEKIRRQITETEERLLPIFEEVSRDLQITDSTSLELHAQYTVIIRDIKEQLRVLRQGLS